MQVYLVTELLLGGELLDAVLERGSYSESDARLCFAQLLSGIDYLHSRWAFLRSYKWETRTLISCTLENHRKFSGQDRGKGQYDTKGTTQS